MTLVFKIPISSSLPLKLIRSQKKKCVAKDPILRLHAAITMETLDAAEDGLPAEVEREVGEGEECGADCFGSRPSLALESLAPDSCQMKWFSAVGGTLADQLIRVLGTSVNSDYVSAR